jgi:hypothetical protein
VRDQRRSKNTRHFLLTLNAEHITLDKDNIIIAVVELSMQSESLQSACFCISRHDLHSLVLDQILPTARIYCSFSCILQSLKAPNVRRTSTLIGPLSSALIRPNYAKMSGSMTAKVLGCT